MHEPWTERARRAVVFAQEKATRSENYYVGSGHLLWGILQDTENVGAQALIKSGVNIERLLEDLEKGLQAIPKSRVLDDAHFTDCSKQVIAGAFAYSRINNIGHVGTEHILAALFIDYSAVLSNPQENVAYNVLRRHANIYRYLDNVSEILLEPRMDRLKAVRSSEKEGDVDFVKAVPYEEYVGKLVHFYDGATALVGTLVSVEGGAFLFKDAVGVNVNQKLSPADALKVVNQHQDLIDAIRQAPIKEVYREVKLASPASEVQVHEYE